MKVVQSVALFFQEGSSDKIYEAKIVEDSGKYTVQVAWGRRGAVTSTGTKAVQVPIDAARKAFDKVVREKTSKGYQAITAEVAPAEVAPALGEGSAARVAGEGRKRLEQVAQLLNPVEESQLHGLFSDPGTVAQQKLDGIRILAHVKDGEVTVTNRKGEITGVDKSIGQVLARAPHGTVFDGELVAGAGGGTYWTFDLLQHGDEDLRSHHFTDRHGRLAALLGSLASDRVLPVHVAVTEAEKRALYDTLSQERAEGIVFKKANAPYKPGRPSSGGSQLKYKFVKTADVFITSNAGNAYRMAVYDQGNVRDIGKIFAGTTNESRAQLDEMLARGEQPVAEVRYLYATDTHQLFQPVFGQIREDKDAKECTFDQLIQTNRTVVAGKVP